jgi:signal transduction histidine kinase
MSALRPPHTGALALLEPEESPDESSQPEPREQTRSRVESCFELPDALRTLCLSLESRSNLRIPTNQIECTMGMVADAPAIALYTIAKEALTNVLLHSHASAVGVRLSKRGNTVVLEVVDDGTGIDPRLTTQGLGLGMMMMQTSAEAVDGELFVVSTPGLGTRIRAEVPAV